VGSAGFLSEVRVDPCEVSRPDPDVVDSCAGGDGTSWLVPTALPKTVFR